MKASGSLDKLKKMSESLKKNPNPVELSHPPIKKQMQFLTELTFIHVLKLLGVQDETKLAEIISHLRKGTIFYDFTFLAHNLAKSKTDFDFLTSPENLPAYKKIAEISSEYDVKLLPYVNVLNKIAENKQNGLYSENDEIAFFLDEYGRNKDSVGAKEFLHQFKKILKYRTQKIFEQFISDDIFFKIHQTLRDQVQKITDKGSLAIYVYGLHYYQGLVSNENENILIKHIKFCVEYLSRRNEIEILPSVSNKTFPKFDNYTQAIDYFFNHNKNGMSSLDSFIGFFMDCCSNSHKDANKLCEYLRKNLDKENPSNFPEKESDFNSYFAETVRKNSKKGKLYTKIYDLLPLLYKCKRSPVIKHSGNKILYTFNDENGKFLFHALKNEDIKKIPFAGNLIEVEILKQNKQGYATEWKWHSL